MTIHDFKKDQLVHVQWFGSSDHVMRFTGEIDPPTNQIQVTHDVNGKGPWGSFWITPDQIRIVEQKP